MDKKHALALLRTGNVSSWNAARQRNESIPSLTGVDLSGKNLSGADLSDTIITNADFTSTIFAGANLSRANLSDAFGANANFDHGRLEQVTLSSAMLPSASFVGAKLNNANFMDARLNRARLTGADASSANFWGTTLSQADCTDANFTDARLERAVLVGTTIEGAVLDGARIHGTSAWDLVGNPASQAGLVIDSPVSRATLTVDDLEVAQFVYLLLNNSKIRNAIETLGRKAVLILGRFTDHRLDLLKRIKAKLRELDFLPILFDFERAAARDWTETITILAGLSRFIIADITAARSAGLELDRSASQFVVPIVPIIEGEESPFDLFIDLQRKLHVLPLVRYATSKDLIAALESAVVAPALERSEVLVAQRKLQIVERRIPSNG